MIPNRAKFFEEMQAALQQRGSFMNEFHCTKCGALMQAPVPGRSGACPNCGQLFETPAAPGGRPTAYDLQRPLAAGDTDFGLSLVDSLEKDERTRSPGDDRWDEPEAEAPYTRTRRMPHSGLGIASFIMGLLVLLTVLLSLMSVPRTPIKKGHRSLIGVPVPAVSEEQVMAGGLICVAGLASGVGLVGLGLGLAAVFQKDRKRTFVVIGLILNGLGTAVLFIIGMAVASALT
jgi:hypothetical protein